MCYCAEGEAEEAHIAAPENKRPAAVAEEEALAAEAAQAAPVQDLYYL